MTARCPGPVAAKQAKNHQTSISVMDSWYEVFVCLCIIVKHLHFGLVCPKDFVPDVLRFVQMQLCKPKPWQPSPGNSSKHAILVSSFSNCMPWTLTIYMLTEACRVWGVATGCFAISLSIARFDLGVNLLECLSSPGKIGNSVEWFPLANNLSHCRIMDLSNNPSQIDGCNNYFSMIYRGGHNCWWRIKDIWLAVPDCYLLS